MKKKTLQDLNFTNKKTIVRVDFNVPIIDGVISDDNRIIMALETINYLITQKARIILMSHLGRIKTAEDLKKKSLKIVAERLAQLLKQPVIFVDEIKGHKLETAIDNLQPGEVLLMENTRFADYENQRESKNDPDLGKYWASLAEIFVNDAFGTTHRMHASNVGIANNIKESCVGFLVEKELQMLSQAINNPLHPLLVILGGVKVSDKIGVIDNLLKIADNIIIAGAMAYTFEKAQGYNVGTSLVETDKLSLAKEYLLKGQDKLVLPVDHVISKDFVDEPGIVNEHLNIPDGYMGMDVGPKSIDLFKSYIAKAKTIIWNGPVGVFEMKNFNKGTLAICEAIAQQKDIFSVIGGGDSAAAAIQLGFRDNFTWISTGGGASLEFFEGKPLVGIEAIQDKK